MRLLSGRAHRRVRRSVLDLDGDGRSRLRRLVANSTLAVLPTSDVIARIEARLAPGTVGLVVAARPELGIDQTIAVAELLASLGHSVTPQIDASEIRNRRHWELLLQRLSRRRVERILIVERTVNDAEAIGRLLDELGDLPGEPVAVGIEGFPNGRPGVEPEQEAELLLQHARAAVFVSTAPSIEPARLLGWITEMRVRGLELPLEIGVPGVVPMSALRREAPELAASPGVREAAVYDPTSLAVEVADDHAIDRLAISGLRLDTYNEVGPTQDWRHWIYDLAPAERSG